MLYADMIQFLQACEAWKREAEEANRKYRAAEEDKLLLARQRDDVSLSFIRQSSSKSRALQNKRPQNVPECHAIPIIPFQFKWRCRESAFPTAELIYSCGVVCPVTKHDYSLLLLQALGKSAQLNREIEYLRNGSHLRLIQPFSDLSNASVAQLNSLKQELCRDLDKLQQVK